MKPENESKFGIKARVRSLRITRVTVASILAAIFCFLWTAAADAAGWYNSNWQYRKKLTIDYTKVGATLSNFPVLVSLSSDSDLAARARSDGYDSLFTSSDGTTKLDHEIEQYTSATGQLVAWVRIPSLSNSADTSIHMYYGYASATNQQNVTGVWNANGGTATNYSGVWHINQTIGTTISDSASSANALGYRGGAGGTCGSRGVSAGGSGARYEGSAGGRSVDL
jgi:hypothetical protein